MNKLTTLLRLGAVLLLFIGFTTGNAWAQGNYAEPGGLAYAGDQSCGDPNNACSLAGAVEDATDGGVSSNEIYVRLVQTGGTTTFEEDLVGAARINEDVVFDTYLLPGPVTGVEGNVEIAGDIIIGAGDILDIAPNLTLRYVGQPGRVELRDGAEIAGSGGFLEFSANTGSHFIQLGNPSVGCAGASPKVGTIENLRIDKIGGTVTVRDQCAIDDESDLFITNRLEVLNGTLDMLDNNLWMVGPTNDLGIDGGVEIGGGALIEGDGTFFIAVDPAALGGPPNNFTDCYEITGAGNLNMAFDKITDAGVCVELSALGNGGISINRAGALYVKDATTFNGTFKNEGAARTEYWALTEITSNLEVSGPGGEVFPGNGLCDDGNGFTGDNSGVYFFTAVTVGEELIMVDTDDPTTAPCVEGVWFMGDSNPDIQGAPKAAAKTAADDPSPFSTITETFTADEMTGIYLDSYDFIHNVAFEGDFAFDESPIFVLDSPADNFPVGNLCATYTPFSIGNKVLFTGDDDQNLLYNTLLDIQSVQVNKGGSSDDVEIDETSAAFLIDTSLEIIKGNFVTNGLLDANAGTTRGEGATVVINRDADGDGVLEAGNSDRAYLSDAIEHTPRKVKYTGSTPHFTGDEIPGDASGEVGDDDRLFLDELEIFASDPTSVITLGKDFTLVSQVTLTQGILDVGSSRLRLENLLLAAIGNGEVSAPDQIGSRGELIFPSEHVDDFEAGDDGIDLLYFGTTDRTVGLLWPPAETDVAGRKVTEDDIHGVKINPSCSDDITISLRDDDIRSRINGNLLIGADSTMAAGGLGTNVGALDIVGQILEINAVSDNDTVLEVHNDADLCDSANDVSCEQGEAAPRAVELAHEVTMAFDEYKRTRSEEAKAALQVSIAALEAEKASTAKTADSHLGLLRFIGSDDTAVWIETSTGRLRFDFPNIEVDRGSESHVTFDAEGVLATTTGDVPANNPDELGTPSFHFKDADLGDDDLTFGDAGGVELLDGLDILDVGGSYRQYDGEFLMAGVSSIGPAPTKEFNQTVRVGFTREPGDFVQDNGEFFTSGGDVDVFGDFLLGATDATAPGDALFSLDFNGEHSVVGDFRVGPNTDSCSEDENGDESLTAADPACTGGVGGEERRNRYFLGGECGVLDDLDRDKGGLFLNGDYWFEGTGDRFDDLDFLDQEQGLQGNVFFVGAIVQDVWMRQDEDAMFCDVVMASRSEDNDGIELQSNTWQNDEGTLTLEHGIIDTNEEAYDWIILNPGIETDLAKRNNSARGEGVVDLGSRDSYINGEVDRVVEFGNAGGGIVTGGYLFPVGSEGEERDDGVVGTRNVDFFRPLILQFPDDLGRSSVARVDYRQDLLPEDCEFPDEGIVVDAFGGGTLTLDVISDQFWQLEFDRIPSFDPNVRVEADELPNVFDMKSLRIVQWDCDCTNPRLAGIYDLETDPGVDDGSFAVNDRINGVPNLTQEGVNVNGCNILGVASNFLINPINLPPISGGLARVQIIHNVVDTEVDVYVDNNRILDDWPFQSATGFITLAGGEHTIDIVAAADADNSNPLTTETVSFSHLVNYNIIAHGDADNFNVVVVDGVRLVADSDDVMNFYMVHGAPDVGEVDIRLLNPVNNNEVIGLLANNISFDDVGTYLSLAPAGYNVELTTADNSEQLEVYRFELQSFGQQTFVLNLSDEGRKNAEGGLTIMGVETSGNLFFPDIITATETTEVPEEFELKGNYPNPFNPATKIQFDLPETAEVTVEIIDMLGRNVMTLPARQLEAGTARNIEVNATNLASGTYLYRVIAKTATDTMVKTGRMMLIK